MNSRPANTSDYDQIADIHHRSYHFATQDKLPKNYLNTLTPELFSSRWTKRASDPSFYTFVAEENEKILGFVTAVLPKDNHQTPQAQIRFFYVDPLHINQKIGSRLAEKFAEALIKMGYQSLHGEVLQGDPRSNAFYKKFGAKITKSESIWLPLGTTPESFPSGTYAPLHHYEIANIRAILNNYTERHAAIKQTTSLFAKTTTIEPTEPTFDDLVPKNSF